VTVHDPLDIAAASRSASAERPATALVHDSADARVVTFRIEPGQRVATHTSPSSVLLSVLEGRGFVSGAAGEREVRSGELVAYAPDEPHGMRAEGERLVLLAVITPRPGGR